MSIHGQEAMYGADVVTRLADTDYERIAEAFGAYGEWVTRAAQDSSCADRPPGRAVASR